MSNIKNENGIKNPPLRYAISRIREQLEHRAMWLAVLTDEAEKNGLKPEAFARDAIYRCGRIQGENLSGGSKDFRTLKKNLFGYFARKVFEMEIAEATDDKLSIDFHYCPLVKAWQKMGYDDERIKTLCDTAMCGDRGIISRFGGALRLDLDETIAGGADRCKIRFVRDDAEKSEGTAKEPNADVLPQATADVLPQATADVLPQATADVLPQATAAEAAADCDESKTDCGERADR